MLFLTFLHCENVVENIFVSKDFPRIQHWKRNCAVKGVLHIFRTFDSEPPSLHPDHLLCLCAYPQSVRTCALPVMGSPCSQLRCQGCLASSVPWSVVPVTLQWIPVNTLHLCLLPTPILKLQSFCGSALHYSCSITTVFFFMRRGINMHMNY